MLDKINTTAEGGVRYKVLDAEGYDTGNLHRAIQSGIITKEDQAVFWEAIADISKKNYKAFARTKNGGFIIETQNVMMFTDADFKAPTLSKVIVFPYGEYVDTEDARTAIRNEVRNYGRSYQSVEFFESLHGPGFVTEYNAQNYSAYAGQISRGKGKDGSGVDSQSGSRGIRHKGEGGLHSGSEIDSNGNQLGADKTDILRKLAVGAAKLEKNVQKILASTLGINSAAIFSLSS